MNEIALKNALNNLYADRVNQVSAKTLGIYAEGNWTQIRDQLSKWQAEGAIQILHDPETAGPSEPCIELLHSIS